VSRVNDMMRMFERADSLDDTKQLSIRCSWTPLSSYTTMVSISLIGSWRDYLKHCLSPQPSSPPTSPSSPPTSPPLSPLQCGPGTVNDPVTASCAIDCQVGRRTQEATAQPYAGGEQLANLQDLLVEAGRGLLGPAAKAEGLVAIDQLRETLDKLRQQLL